MIKIGTRGSPLALAQANMTATALRAAHGWDESATEIVIINTQGDRVQDRALAEIGGRRSGPRNSTPPCSMAGSTVPSIR